MSSKLILAGSGYPSLFMNSKMFFFQYFSLFLSLIALHNIIINCYVTDKFYHMVCLFILVISSKQTLTVSQACGQKYETSRLERFRLDQRQPSLKMLGYIFDGCFENKKTYLYFLSLTELVDTELGSGDVAI
jgi:hypothetical protein